LNLKFVKPDNPSKPQVLLLFHTGRRQFY